MAFCLTVLYLWFCIQILSLALSLFAAETPRDIPIVCIKFLKSATITMALISAFMELKELKENFKVLEENLCYLSIQAASYDTGTLPPLPELSSDLA